MSGIITSNVVQFIHLYEMKYDEYIVMVYMNTSANIDSKKLISMHLL